MRKSIRFRLAFMYLLIISVSFLALGGYFLQRMERFYLQSLEGQIYQKARVVTATIEALGEDETGFKEKVEHIIHSLRKEANLGVVFITGDGSMFGGLSGETADDYLQRPEVLAARQKAVRDTGDYAFAVDEDAFHFALILRVGDFEGSILCLSESLTHLKASIARIKFTFFLGLITALAVSTMLSLRFSQKVIKPLEEIGDVARSISKGDFDRNVSFRSDDELGALAVTINEMGRTLKGKVEQISNEKSKLETVMSAMTSGVILCNAAGKVDFINDSALAIFGVKREDAVDFPLHVFLRHYLFYENLQDALSKGGARFFELNLFYPEARVLQVHMVPVARGRDEIVGALAVLHDITGLRSLERMRSEFVANVSHELRTPLTTIKGYAETLLDKDNWEDIDEAVQILAIIDREAERLNRLLKDLLNLSQIESSKGIMKKQKVDVRQVAEEAVMLLRSQALEKALEIKILTGEPEVKSIQGDPDWLLQLFIDVLDNAIKYTPQDGKIDIFFEQKPGEVVVSVRDTGIGIPAKKLQYIFERFYRVDKARSRRLGGTGLGLAIVKHIVEAHNARIEVKSSPGAGTTFLFYFPAD